MVAETPPEDLNIYSHEEQLLLAEALLQDTSHEHFDTHSKRPGAAAAGLVSRDFMSSLSAEVDSLLYNSLPLNDVSSSRQRPDSKAAVEPSTPGAVAFAAPSPGRKEPKDPKDSDWSIRRPETHVLGGTYTLFGPPPRPAKRSVPSTGPKLATYERNVEFVKQREARLESARKERDDQEKGQLVSPAITDGSRRLVSNGYSPPWDGKKSTTHSCRAQKVLKDALELKAQEEAEHTFQPAINQRSKAIFRHVINTGQPWHDRVHAGDRPGKPPGTKALTPEEQQHSFQPEISRKAQQLRREGHVSERLYRGEAKGDSEAPKKTRALQKRISRMLARECQAAPVPGAQGDEVKPETNTDQAEAAAAAPKVSGISKLVEALSKRAEKEGSRDGVTSAEATPAES